MPMSEVSSPEKLTRMSAREWKEAEALYVSGEMGIADLVKKFGRNKDTFARHFRKKGLKRASRAEEHARIVEEELSRRAADDLKLIADRARETKEEHYQYSRGLGGLAFQTIQKARADNVPLSSVLGNLKAIESAMNVIKKAREERFAVLGLDKDNPDIESGLPELIIQELSDSQVAELRAIGEEDQGPDLSEIDEMQGVQVYDGDDEYDDNEEEQE